MLTIKAEIKKQEKRQDGTFNVKIRFTLDRKIKRISTSIFVKSSDLNKNGDLKRNTSTYKEIEKLILTYQLKCQEMQVDVHNYSLETIVKNLLDNRKHEKIDFIEFSREWIKTTQIKGAINYSTAINSFIRFLKRDSLDITDLNAKLLKDYTNYLQTEYREKSELLKRKGMRVPSNRMLSLYLGAIRHLYKEAQMKYNDYENNKIIISDALFKVFKVPKQQVTRKRAISKTQLLAIFNLQYRTAKLKSNNFNRFNLAKDTFILSFCLMGINSVDLYEATLFKKGRIIYERTKTKERREDSARMEIDVPPIVNKLMQKYKDLTGKRVFNFYQHYSDRTSFNRAINLGLKEIGKIIGVDDLEFYAARHTWATLAVNEVGIDKYTVHSALNHLDSNMRVTDIYIQRNFAIENNANKKVVEYVFNK